MAGRCWRGELKGDCLYFFALKDIDARSCALHINQMLRHRYVGTIAVLAVLISSICSASVAASPLPESPDVNIGYDTVADALTNLRIKPGVTFSTVNGWTIATDEAAYTIWSFAPASYPAYPAVVKRQVTAEGRGSRIQMSVYCEAAKRECDDLVRTFSAMNGFEVPK